MLMQLTIPSDIDKKLNLLKIHFNVKNKKIAMLMAVEKYCENIKLRVEE